MSKSNPTKLGWYILKTFFFYIEIKPSFLRFLTGTMRRLSVTGWGDTFLLGKGQVQQDEILYFISSWRNVFSKLYAFDEENLIQAVKKFSFQGKVILINEPQNLNKSFSHLRKYFLFCFVWLFYIFFFFFTLIFFYNFLFHFFLLKTWEKTEVVERWKW